MGAITFRIATKISNLVATLILGSVSPALEASLALAQGATTITPTTGVGGFGTTVTTDGGTAQITGGTRSNNGTNLFHSFEQFSVGRPDTAQFLNTTPSIPTTNILSRVTGGIPSSIFGTIETASYPNANLFLMNPAGIVFGPNATLNVSGSVAFTTADYLRLADANGSNAGIFHASTTLTSLLTSASVAAFGFLSTNPPAAIAVNGSTLAVQPGQSITLVGGNISVQSGTLENGTVPLARLSAPGGQINMASVASPGEILAGTLNKAPNINGQSFETLGTVEISKNSTIDSSGAGGGTILVRGGRFIVDDSTISANSTVGRRLDPAWLGIGIEIEVAQDTVVDNGAVIETNVESGAQHESGGVRITADQITISGGPKVLAFVEMNPEADTPFAGIRSNVGAESTAARSGDISLSATAAVRIEDYGQVETNASSDTSGDLGNIMINSTNGSLNLTGHAKVSSFAEPDSRGNTGSIKIDARRGDITLVQSDLFNSANGSGTLKDIQIAAHNLRLRDFSSIGGDNEITSMQIPGDTVITLSGQLSLADGSFINTGTFGSVPSANLLIQAPEILIGGQTSSGFSSGLYTSTISSGDGGRLRLFTDKLQLIDGGILSSKSFIGFEEEIPSGRGGAINIEGLTASGPSIIIDGAGSGISASAEGTGTAGDIFLKASSVTMTNEASITARSSGQANAGIVDINAGRQLVVRNSSITTEAKQASGGDITLRATDRIQFTNSALSTSVLESDGSGGNIFIDQNAVILQNSLILSQAVLGNGGNITIVAPLLLMDSNSVIDTSSKAGLDGKVTARSNLVAMIPQLESKATAPQVLLQNRCIALAGGEQSTFILAGRDALPSEPGGWLSSPVAMEHWTGEETEEHVSGLMVRSYGLNNQPLLVMSKDETTVLSLRRLTPPGFLVRSFAVSAATGCSS